MVLGTRTQRKLELLGRSVELDEVTGLLEALRNGPGALIVEGDAGIGKTALLKECIDRARRRGCVVIEARPAEAEAGLPFAALSDLVAGCGDEVVDRLPAPQRRALDVAMLRVDSDGAPLERRAVAVALLSILRCLSGEAPVLIAIDDLQWIDGASAASLAYALRRIDDERVGLVASRRPAPNARVTDLVKAVQAGGARQVRLSPLDRHAVAALLVDRSASPIPPATVLRIHRLSGGNPFLALELARAFGDRSATATGDALPLPHDLRELVRERLERVSMQARRASIFVAALPQPSLSDVESALEPSERSGLKEAIAAGILESEGSRLRFTHPLLGSIIYSEAPAVERRRVHARLASITRDPDEHARHLAAAAIGHDSAVADLLEASASRALQRGAPDAAAELLERSAALTDERESNTLNRRLLFAAERHLEAGTTDAARDLFERVERDGEDELMRRTAGARLGVTCLLAGDVAGATAAFERSSYAEGLAWAAECRGDSVVAARHARAAVARAEADGDPAALATALASVALFEARIGRPAALTHIERALAVGASQDRLQLSRAAPKRIHAQILMGQGHVEHARSVLRELYDSESERGSEGSLAIVLATLSLAEIRAGALDEAGVHAREGYLSTLGTGQRLQRIYTLATAAHVAAIRGDDDETHARVEEAGKLISRTDFDPLLGQAGTVLGMLELSRGDAAAAHRALEPFENHLVERPVRESGWFRFLADEVEALVLLDNLAAATRTLAKLEARRGVLLDRWWASQAILRCRGVLAAAVGDSHAATRQLAVAVEVAEGGEEPYELARSLLALGRLQRRLKQRAASRSSLARADEVFARLGAPLWRERVADEMRRIGGRPTRAPGLTATEERVAELASQGLTNREIAAAAFLSVNTVQAYLKRVYRERGVRSRTELARSFHPPTAGKEH